jgi:hypothetical protein
VGDHFFLEADFRDPVDFRDDDFFEPPEDFFDDDFFEPPEDLRDDDFFEPDFFEPLFFEPLFVRPSSERCLFTVAAAICLARLLDRPFLLALSLICSYWRSSLLLQASGIFLLLSST